MSSIVITNSEKLNSCMPELIDKLQGLEISLTTGFDIQWLGNSVEGYNLAGKIDLTVLNAGYVVSKMGLVHALVNRASVDRDVANSLVSNLKEILVVPRDACRYQP